MCIERSVLSKPSCCVVSASFDSAAKGELVIELTGSLKLTAEIARKRLGSSGSKSILVESVHWVLTSKQSITSNQALAHFVEGSSCRSLRGTNVQVSYFWPGLSPYVRQDVSSTTVIPKYAGNFFSGYCANVKLKTLNSQFLECCPLQSKVPAVTFQITIKVRKRV